MVLEGTRGTRIQSYDRNAHRKPAHGDGKKILGGGGSNKGEIHSKVHCGLEGPGVLLAGKRLFHWTVIRGMKLRIQYVGVVALMRGKTKKRAFERVLARVGARAGQRGSTGAGAVWWTT